MFSPVWTGLHVDTDKGEELSSDGHFDSNDDDDDDNGGVPVSQPSSASYSPSPSRADPAATNQSTVDLLTETQNRERNHLKIQKIILFVDPND